MKAGIYRHWKGDYYLVLGLAQNSTNDGDAAEYVVYVSLDPTRPGPRMRVRKKSEFYGSVYPDTGEAVENYGFDRRSVFRFKHVGDEIPKEK